MFIPDRSITLPISATQTITWRPRNHIEGPYRVSSPEGSQKAKIFRHLRKKFGGRGPAFPRPRFSSQTRNKEKNWLRKLRRALRMGRDRNRDGTKVVQTGVDPLPTRGRRFVSGVKSLFRSKRDGSDGEEGESRDDVHEGTSVQRRPVAIEAQRRTGNDLWRQGCRVGEVVVNVAGRRGIYDREGLPNDTALIGSSPPPEVYSPTGPTPRKTSEPAGEVLYHECAECPFGESSESWSSSEDSEEGPGRERERRPSDSTSTLQPESRKSRSSKEKVSTFPKSSRAASPDREPSKSSPKSKSWPRLPKHLEFPSSGQQSGNFGEVKDAKFILSFSASQDSLVNIKVENKPNTSFHKKPAETETEQRTKSTNNPQVEETAQCPDGEISSMEFSMRPLPHIFAAGYAGLSPGVVRLRSSTSASSSRYDNPMQSERLSSIDEASATSEFSAKDAFVANELSDEDIRMLAPNAKHVPEPRLILRVRYLSAALQEAMDTAMPNMFPDAGKTKSSADEDGSEVSSTNGKSKSKRPPLTIKISENTPKPSNLRGTSWSFVENHHFDKVEDELKRESSNGSKASTLSPQPPNVYQIGRLSRNDLDGESIILLNIESTANDFGFRPALAPMLGSWPYMPPKDAALEADEQESIAANRGTMECLALEPSAHDLDTSEYLYYSQYVTPKSEPETALTTEGALMFTRCRPIPRCVEPPPSPANSPGPERLSQDYGPPTPFCSPSTSPLQGSGAFSVHFRGGAGEVGLTDIFKPTKEQGDAKAGREMLKQKMGKFDAWVVGYQPKRGETWKTFVRKTEQRIAEGRRVKPPGRMSKFSSALGGAFKGLLADENEANEERGSSATSG